MNLRCLRHFLRSLFGTFLNEHLSFRFLFTRLVAAHLQRRIWMIDSVVVLGKGLVVTVAGGVVLVVVLVVVGGVVLVVVLVVAGGVVPVMGTVHIPCMQTSPWLQSDTV
jgi:hypothetical protein